MKGITLSLNTKSLYSLYCMQNFYIWINIIFWRSSIPPKWIVSAQKPCSCPFLHLLIGVNWTHFLASLTCQSFYSTTCNSVLLVRGSNRWAYPPVKQTPVLSSWQMFIVMGSLNVTLKNVLKWNLILKKWWAVPTKCKQGFVWRLRKTFQRQGVQNNEVWWTLTIWERKCSIKVKYWLFYTMQFSVLGKVGLSNTKWLALLTWFVRRQILGLLQWKLVTHRTFQMRSRGHSRDSTGSQEVGI